MFARELDYRYEVIATNDNRQAVDRFIAFGQSDASRIEFHNGQCIVIDEDCDAPVFMFS